MKNKLAILLLSSPAFIGTMLLTLFGEKPAQAVELESKNVKLKGEIAPKANIACNREQCTGNNYLANFPRVVAANVDNDEFKNLDTNEYGHLLLEITEEESDTAIALFGCDCVNAVDALRQMRGIPIGVQGNKILPGPTLKPCTQRAPEIN